ncbi:MULTISPECIES: hypothetical protein [unclassified Nocardioides]|uniref:hypothetical protein n=1 Tax=unclassified Nocardioides TaxID=2615069 RepID=UPI002666F80D|nr:hypothetical protein [Nocardioides sp. Arc9.136]WKN48399.1 hypothetical protein OSR43_20525 [Nocardioides sp. Arc9.136]
MLRTALAASLLLVPLTGCTGGSEDPDGAPAPGPAGAAAEVRDGLAALYAGDHASATDTADGECFADALLAEVPVEELEAAGVLVDGSVAPTSPALEPALAEQWVDAMFGCMDFVEESARAQVAFTKGKVDWREYAACLRDALDEDAVRDAVVGTLTGDWGSPAVAALTDAQADCSASATPTTG